MRARIITRWIGLVSLAAILIAFIVSTRRAITWTAPGMQQQFTLMLGAFSVGWRPEGWRLEDDRFAGRPGCSRGEFQGATWVWWVQERNNTAWEWITVPLWIPFLVLTIPISWLWYRDRKHVLESWRRWRDRLRPPRRLRVALGVVAAFTVIHGVVITAFFMLTERLYYFFVPPQFGVRDTFQRITGWAAPIMFWSAPAWALLWAWLYVRLRNRLLWSRDQARCSECGYDLSGNKSGVCPECGTATRQDAGSTSSPI